MDKLETRLVGFAGSAASKLSLPGGGHTAHRLHQLFEWGTADLSFARIAEAHTDALAILAETGHSPRAGALYGVWASDAPPSRVTCQRTDDGTWCIHGTKQFCSGATLLDAALVTAHDIDGVLLFDLPIRHERVTAHPSAWANPGFADTATTAVSFDHLMIGDEYRVGSAGWYLDRPGFWHGAAGPAACWAGGAQSLIDAAVASRRKDPHSRAHIGALESISWAFNALFEQAGREIDRDPGDSTGTARQRALKLRHLVERFCAETLDRFGRATGPHLLAYDARIIQQHTALAVYIRQCHGERDLETIPAPVVA